jgi:hypothetical protein
VGALILMQITIRDRSYPAEHLTDLNYLPLASLWVEDDGSFALSNVAGFESLTEQQKLRLTQPMMKRLCNPEVKASVAQSLSAVFPQIPADLVSYDKGIFTLNLTLKEVLEIAIACGNELQRLQQPVAEVDEVAKLKAEIELLKAAK